MSGTGISQTSFLVIVVQLLPDMFRSHVRTSSVVWILICGFRYYDNFRIGLDADWLTKTCVSLLLATEFYKHEPFAGYE